jgi:hypothetical protein
MSLEPADHAAHWDELVRLELEKRLNRRLSTFKGKKITPQLVLQQRAASVLVTNGVYASLIPYVGNA